MKVTIQLKIVMIYICTIIIIMLISGSFIVYNTEARDYKAIQANMEKTADSLKTRMSWNLDSLTKEDFKAEIGTTINNMKIYILTPKGKVKFGTSSQMEAGQVVGDEVVIKAIQKKIPVTAPIEHFSEFTGDGTTQHATPIINPNGDVQAIIYISASVQDVYDNTKSIIKTIALGSLVAMFITGICGIAFSRMITEPIKKLTDNSKKLAAGNSIDRIPVEATDEIGELTQSFNYMASQLGMTMEVITSEKNKLEKIFEHMADGIMAFNTLGVLIHVNSACYEMIGTLNMEHRFEPIMENMGLKISFKELLDREKTLNLEEPIIINEKYLNIHSDIYVNSKGEPDGVVLLLQDVTKQQKLEQMRKEFVANVSHELRTPLTTVKSYTETLMDGAIEDHEVALHFLGVMDKETDRMTALVKDLLELSRIDNKQIQLNKEPIDMHALIDEVIEVQMVHIQKGGHQLIYNVDNQKEYFIEGDSARVKQIVHNILSNAIKYSPDPGTITITLEKDNAAHIIVKIQDTGLGIPKEDLGRIFERFYRVDKARSRKLGGTGLGLSISKELMELQGGSIHIDSEAGKGTSVILKFNEEKKMVGV